MLPLDIRLIRILATAACCLLQTGPVSAEGPDFVVWNGSPYIALAPTAQPPDDVAPPQLLLEAAINEYEHVVFNVTNRGSQPQEFRLVGRLPGQVGGPRSGMNLPVQEVAAQEGNPLKTKASNVPEKPDGLAMPLVELNSLATFFVPPGRTRQIWLTVQTADVAPGRSRHELRVVPLGESAGAAVKVPVEMTVWDFRLDDEAPIGVFCFDYSGDYQWLRQHKINLWFRGAFPGRGIELDAEGNLGEFRTDIDRVKKRLEEGARRFLFSYGYTGSFAKWAKEQEIEYMSPGWQRLFKQVLTRLVSEWKAAGLDYDDFALQTIDEAHGELVQQVIDTTPLVREVDPKVRTAMTIMTDLDELRQMAPHVDVWLNRNGAIWGPEQAEFFAAERAQGKPIWSWSMPNTPKSKPLRDFRTYGWRAMTFDFDAIGFFLYSGMVYDPYRPGGGFSTRHWEAWRDGVEDYQYLWTLKQEIGNAEARGVAGDRLDAARRLIGQAVDDVITETFFPPETQETHDRLQHARRQIAEEILALKSGRETASSLQPQKPEVVAENGSEDRQATEGLVPEDLPAGENLAPNPSFEMPSAADPARPADWTPTTGGRIEIEWSDTVARTGRRSLAMLAYPEERYAHAYWTSSPIALKPGMAYRVSFYFMAEGGGVPIFELQKVKNWRLKRGGTEGAWLKHEDVVVVPAGITEARFAVHNYNRPGKKLWFDDLSIVELPLAESPLTARVDRAGQALAALMTNMARFELQPQHREDLAALDKHLAEVKDAYATLATGNAQPADFDALLAGLDALEKGFADYRYLVWTVDAEPWQHGDHVPSHFAQPAEHELADAADGSLTVYLGIQSMVGEGLPGSVVLQLPRSFGDWQPLLTVTPAVNSSAGDSQPWGTLNRLGEVYLPPNTPRMLKLEWTGPAPKPGTYEMSVNVACLDRLDEVREVKLRIEVPKAE